MPQGQLYGLPRRGMEPTLWRPRICQLSTNNFIPGSALALRKPNDVGQVAVIGQLVVASADVKFDVAGAGTFVIQMELPYFIAVEPSAANVLVGVFTHTRASGAQAIGNIEGAAGGNTVVFRNGTVDNGYGSGAAVTIAAGDSWKVQLSYFGMV